MSIFGPARGAIRRRIPTRCFPRRALSARNVLGFGTCASIGRHAGHSSLASVPGTVLVGLLTSESEAPAFSSLLTQTGLHATMATKEWSFPRSRLQRRGRSGLAPDSLFVGHSKREHPTTNTVGRNDACYAPQYTHTDRVGKRRPAGKALLGVPGAIWAGKTAETANHSRSPRWESSRKAAGENLPGLHKGETILLVFWQDGAIGPVLVA